MPAIKLENVTFAMLGRAKKVMIDKENTTIVSGHGKKADRLPRRSAWRSSDRSGA